jgi:hypothetical protein
MADEETVEETKGPRQTVSRMPEDTDIGPHFPSGMSAPEAALAGATADMSDEDVAKLKGETAEAPEEEAE